MRTVTAYATSRALDKATQLYEAVYGVPPIPIIGQKGAALGTATAASMINGLEAMSKMAYYLGDDISAVAYQAQADVSRSAVDRLLWNATAGTYASSLGSPDFDLNSISLAITAKIGTEEKRNRFLEKLSELAVPAGYIKGDGNTVLSAADPVGLVNPYNEGFLLWALGEIDRTDIALPLIQNTWDPWFAEMSTALELTGSIRKCMFCFRTQICADSIGFEQSGDGVYPGLDLFTADSHFWASYPTVFLIEGVLGVRPNAKG